MSNTPTFTLELTAQQAALVSLVLTHAALSTINPGLKPPTVTLPDLIDVYHIAHQLGEQILTQEH